MNPLRRLPSPSRLPLGRSAFVRAPLALAALFAAFVGVTAALLRPASADGPAATPASATGTPVATHSRWPAAVVEKARSLPIQESGRVMPLAQWARFTLVRLNHRESVKDASGRTLEPVEWALDVLFRPELAARYETFLVETWEVLEAVDYRAPEGKKKRDRYSYFDLEASREALLTKADAYGRIDPKERDAVQSGVVAVAHNLRTFEQLAELLSAAHFEGALSKVPALAPVFAPATTVRASDVLGRLPELRAKGAAANDPRVRDAGLLLAGLSDVFGRGDLFALFPPEGDRAAEGAWHSPVSLFEAAMKGAADGTRPDPALLVELRQLEDASRAADADDMTAFQRAFDDFHARTTTRAKARGEYDKVGLEVFLLRLDPFYWAKILYLIAFLLVATTWLWRARPVAWAGWSLLLAGLALHVAGITIRCILRGRPPVTTLYETTLFISAFGVAGAAVLERIQRRGVGFAIAPVLGALGLFIANRYETITGDDPMPQLVAVLDTNFWLSTHVTCVTIGYAASLLAAAIAHVHVVSHVFGWKRNDGDFTRSVVKATYGMLAFALVFSTVGTILGGVWANESWGRFWGWDPKENGALMIVLAQLAVLHGRLGGILKPLGVSIATIATGCIVAFSWWGVNLLGVGLHSYGFTAGLWFGLQVFWGLEIVVMGAGMLVRRAT